MSGRWLTLLAAAVGLLAAAACTTGGGEPDGAASAPADAATAQAAAPAGAVDLAAAPSPSGDVPGRDPSLAKVEWPAAAAWIRRETAAGHPVVVNFFASWCGPCRREAPLLRDARAANPSVTFLGVAYQDFVDDARGFLEETGLEWPTLLDPDGTVGAAMGVRGMPTTFFFAADGQLVDTVTGELSEDELQAQLAELTAGSPAA